MPLTPEALDKRVAWLRSVLQSATDAAEGPGQFGLFGTAIAATWLFGALAARTAFFVDEDPARIGRRHVGRPIIAPSSVPKGAIVFVPLVPRIATNVVSRLARLGIDVRNPPPHP